MSIKNIIPVNDNTPKPEIVPELGASVWVLGYNDDYKPCKWRVVRLASDGYWECAESYSTLLGRYLATQTPTHFMYFPTFPTT